MSNTTSIPGADRPAWSKGATQEKEAVQRAQRWMPHRRQEDSFENEEAAAIEYFKVGPTPGGCFFGGGWVLFGAGAPG